MNYQNFLTSLSGIVATDDIIKTPADEGFDFLDSMSSINTGNNSVFYIVQDRVAWNLTLETEETQEFQPVGFRMDLPKSGDNGIQELNIEIDNVGKQILAFIKSVRGSRTPVTVKYRVFISSDTSAPVDPVPLVLYLKKIQVTAMVISGQATFLDLATKRFPNEDYTRSRFTSLGD